MTQNQLKYWELQEMKRANLASENIRRQEADTKASADQLNWRMAPYIAAEKVQGVKTGMAKQFSDVVKGVIGILSPVTTALFS